MNEVVDENNTVNVTFSCRSNEKRNSDSKDDRSNNIDAQPQ